MAREVSWYGLDESQVKQMGISDYLKMIPARERRSLLRGYTPAQKKFMKCVESGDKDLKTHCRDLVITPILLGKMIKVYTGKEFLPVTVTLEMLGHRLGEFVLSRKTVKHSAPGIGATKSSGALSVK